MQRCRAGIDTDRDEMSSYFRRMKVEKEFEEVLLGEYKEDKEAKLLASMRELLGKEER